MNTSPSSRSHPRHLADDEDRATLEEEHAEEVEESLGRKIWTSVREILIIIAIAVLLSIVIRTFFFRAFVIPSGSMEQTLQVGDRIFVNLMVPGVTDLKRGDIVVFHDEEGWLPPMNDGESNIFVEGLEFIGFLPDQSEQHLVKRIVGMPGDHVTVDPESRNIVVNGEEIDEPYLYPGVKGSDTDFDVTVPEGKLWVLGDHRNASGDSRAYVNGPGEGFVTIDSVVGRAEVIAWPLNRIGPAGSNDAPFEDVPEP